MSRILYRRRARPPGGRLKMRLAVAAVVAVISIVSYLGMRSPNPVTGEMQFVAMTVEQEIALGLQASPEMAARHGGLHTDREARALVDRVGARLVAGTVVTESPYRFEFHLLADEQMINAFALPGGQIFVTAALFGRLETEGQLAGVLAHEIGHVLQRHSAQRLAETRLTEGLTGAAVLATYDPERPSTRAGAAVAALIGQAINMKYGRDDELESDEWGVRLTAEAGYDPRAMIRVMQILAEAAGGGRPPEFSSTHPDPENRIGRIEQAIRNTFPAGIPSHLE